MTPEQEVATFLHDLFCSYNHTDMCDWEYGSWENPRYAQKRHLKWAHELLDRTMTKYFVGYQNVVGVLKALKESKEHL